MRSVLALALVVLVSCDGDDVRPVPEDYYSSTEPDSILLDRYLKARSYSLSPAEKQLILKWCTEQSTHHHRSTKQDALAEARRWLAEIDEIRNTDQGSTGEQLIPIFYGFVNVSGRCYAFSAHPS